MTHSETPRSAPQIAITHEALAYIAIVLLAGILRVPALGAPPLNDSEAGQAMAAWQVVSGNQIDADFIESPLVFASTALGFAFAGASNTTARLLPMLAGMGLVLLPLGLRSVSGRLPMLIASALLAISPGMVAASRHADGVAASLLFLTLALWAYWRFTETRTNGPLVASGILLGLAVLADFFTLAGILGMLVGIGATLLGDDDQLSTQKALRAAIKDVRWQVPIVALAGTVFVVGTLGLTYPGGLGASADLLGRLVNGVGRRPDGAPFLFGVLTLYEALIVIFGVIGLARGLTSQVPGMRFLSGWASGALLIGFIYPGALPSHALWMVFPLALLAGLMLAESLASIKTGSAWSLALHTAIVVGLFSASLVWTTGYLRRGGSAPLDQNTATTLAQLAASLGLSDLSAAFTAGVVLPLRLYLAILLLILALVSTLLWGSFRGNRHAWRGFELAVLAVAVLTSLNGSAGLAYPRASDPFEPWNIAPAQPALYTLNETAQDIGVVATSHALDATVTIQGSPYGALAWAMRDFNNVTFVDVPSPQVTTHLVITADDESTPIVGERYIGQDFVIARSWNPTGLTFSQALQWIFFRNAPTPTADTRVILWVRDDLYRLLPDELGE